MRIGYVGLASVFSLSAVGAGAGATDLAAVFATRPAAFSAALSPDATKLAYIGAYKAAGRAVVVADLTTGATNVVLASTDLTIRPIGCAFKTLTRLICTLHGIAGAGKEMAGFTRIIAVDIDGKNVKVIGQNTQSRQSTVYSGGSVIDWLPDDPAHVLMQISVGDSDTRDTNIHSAEAGTGAALVDINSGVRKIVERTSPQVYGLDADGLGNVRFRGILDHDPSGYNRDAISYMVRAKGSKEWKPLLRASISDEQAPTFHGFDETADNIFELKLLDGRQALYRVSTDGTNTATLVYAHPNVDVEGVVRIGKYNRAVAAGYAIDRGEMTYFDTKLAGLSAALSRALPGHPEVSIVDESWDGTKKLIYVDGDNVPGRYYLYDQSTKKLAELVSVFPSLDGVVLGTVKSVSYKAHDGTSIPAYLTLPPGRTDMRGLPVVVMPHGGPAARDTSGFDWLTQFFAAKGYAVLQPNFRGSTGYGSDFYGKNAFQGWALAIGDVNDGARWMVSQGADAKKLAIFGWSYGGYAALQANVVDPGLYRATVAVAPVTDLGLLRQEAMDYSNYKQVDAMIGNGPHVLAGSPARHADRFAAPVLMFSGDKDQNVDIEQARTMASALRGAGKKVEMVEYKGLNHALDDSEARRDMLAKSAAFFEAAIK